MVEPFADNLVFILSTPRAGSTLLAAMLGNHSQTLAPPEPWLLLPLHALFSPQAEIIDTYEQFMARIAWHSYMDSGIFDSAAQHFALSVYETLLQKSGKTIFIDKTPRYYHILPWLQRVFPTAKKIWLRRNPLAVIASCKSTWGIPVNEILGNPVSTITFDMTISFSLLTQHFSEERDTNFSIKYEDLVQDSTNTVATLCNFMNIPMEQNMIMYGSNLNMKDIYIKAEMGDKAVFRYAQPHKDSIMRWHKVLSPGEVRSILSTLGRKIFVRQGYEKEYYEAVVWSRLADSEISDEGNLAPIFNAYYNFASGNQLNSFGKKQNTIAKDNNRLRDLLSLAESNSLIHLSDLQRLGKLLEESEADRAERLVDIQRLGTLLEESESDRAARLVEIQRLGTLLEESESDRAARLVEIQRLGTLLEESETDRTARLVEMQRLGTLLEESEADRIARLVEMQRLGTLLEESEADRAARLVEMQRLRTLLEESEADRTARLVESQQLSKLLDESHQQLQDSHKSHHLLEEQLSEENQKLLSLAQENSIFREKVETALEMARLLKSSRVYTFIRYSGRWTWLENLIKLIEDFESGKFKTVATNISPRKTLSKVAVDLTPVLPGGHNGGAKLLAIGLIHSLAKMTPLCDWVLLTSEKSHEELAVLDAVNVHRVSVDKPSGNIELAPWRWAIKLKASLVKVFPRNIVTWLKKIYRKIPARPQVTQIPGGPSFDVLFCPFTGTRFYDPDVPVVSIVHDLQYLYYPQFFSSDDRFYRDKDFKDICAKSALMICVSEHVRETILKNSNLHENLVISIHTCLFDRLKANLSAKSDVLARYDLQPGEFLLYPANFWAHKNHAMLLTAFGMYCVNHPTTNAKLVLTGSPGPDMEKIQEASNRMGLADKLVMPGYISDVDLAALMNACRCLIFPSLYEGFGMPILEAFAMGKPVLCSNATSLPEIAGDAALYFDPRKPHEMLDCIDKIFTDENLERRLIDLGKQRLSQFGNTDEMAKNYLLALGNVINANRRFSDSLYGLYQDGWTGDLLTVTFASIDQKQHVEWEFWVPDWHPDNELCFYLLSSRKKLLIAKIPRGHSGLVVLNLSQSPRYVKILVDPVAQPISQKINNDTRWLGAQCKSCRIVSAEKEIILWPPEIQ